MRTPQTEGNCYLCGKTFKKSSMTTHLKKEVFPEGNEQLCNLLKVEDQVDKRYWLYLDIPTTSSLSSLDRFLRNIWLECCGHMSQFYIPGYDVIGKTQKLGEMPKGAKLCYDYDFGSTTSLVITCMGQITRPAQRSAVRLLARNVPLTFPCCVCGKDADVVNAAVYPHTFYCEACGEKHEEDAYFLPVTNSPRMGECGYCGELDKYAYVPKPKA